MKLGKVKIENVVKELTRMWETTFIVMPLCVVSDNSINYVTGFDNMISQV